jgi:uncharacterized protein
MFPLFHIEEHSFYSARTGREYQLAVKLPTDYATSEKRYPVIYLLDSDTLFGLATSASFFMFLSGIPESIVVGVGFGASDLSEFLKLRELNFRTAEIPGAPPESYAGNFLSAFQDEFLPFIESTYRADPAERSLFGYSSGGFFVLYALYNQPGLFRRYLCGSGIAPAVMPYLLSHDGKLAARDAGSPVDLYLSIGALEAKTLPAFQQLAAVFQEKNYPGLHLITDIYDGLDHCFLGLHLTYTQGFQRCYQLARTTPI